MAGKTVLYVHGFGSSGQSGTVALIQAVLPQARVIAPDLPIHPDEAQALLQQICADEQPDLIIGTSMGAMYAEQLRGFHRICINPALLIAETMHEHGMTGTQTFSNPRKDGVQTFYVDKALVKAYGAASAKRFEGLDADDERRVYGLFGDADTTVNNYDLFHNHYSQSLHFHGEHRLNDHSFLGAVVPVIRWIDDIQARRQRPIIYIGVETLIDGYQKPTASSQKAVRTLIETYQVMIVAPAQSSAPESYGELIQWLEQYFGVPAWGHTIFTNQRHLLFGDYLIEAQSTPDPLATRIAYGSDTFKTWDDIIHYYELLGGQ